MIQKLIVFILIGMLAAVPACASENLLNFVLIDETGIFFAGLDENGEEGVYFLSADGSKTSKVYGEGANLLASSDGYLMLNAPDGDGEYALKLLDLDGNTLFNGDFMAYRAVSAGNVFFADRYKITLEDGKATATEFLNEYCRPVLVYENWLYYQDQSSYALVSAMDDGISMLYRVDTTTGEVERVSGEGAWLMGVAEGSVIYTLDDFYILHNGETKLVSCPDRGVYKADPDGKNAVKLNEKANYSEGFYERYIGVSDGVVYSIYYNYDSAEPVPPTKLKRVTLDGVKLDDISVDFGEPFGVRDEKVFIRATKLDANYEYVCDDIVSFDTRTGERKSLCGEREFVINDDFDNTGSAAVYGERVYFIAAEKSDERVRLWSMDTDGGDIKELAVLYGAP